MIGGRQSLTYRNAKSAGSNFARKQNSPKRFGGNVWRYFFGGGGGGGALGSAWLVLLVPGFILACSELVRGFTESMTRTRRVSVFFVMRVSNFQT